MRLGGPSSAQAQAPATLTYQGQLTEAGGQPASGPLEVRFALHDQASGGDELWSETLPELEPDAQGRVHAELGGQTPLEGVFAQAEPRWLSVQVQGEVLSPRLKLTSVPWAMRAGHARRADQLGDKTLSELVEERDGAIQTRTGELTRTLEQLQARVNALEQQGSSTARLDALEQTVTEQQGQIQSQDQRIEGLTQQLERAQLEVAALTSQVHQKADSSEVMTLRTTVQDQSGELMDLDGELGQARVELGQVQLRTDQLEDLTQDLERTQLHGQPALVLTGANFHVRSGAGATDASPNGRGNLVVGYDEGRSLGSADKTGSHNLIVGSGHSYPERGGLAVGLNHTLEGQFAVAAGGASNRVSADHASITGGQLNQASGAYATVSSGSLNVASADHASVVGGLSNEASARYAVVAAGRDNLSSGSYSAVCGGRNNQASGAHASISGGQGNEASASYSSISAGESNKAQGLHSSVSGGEQNVANAEYASVTGGKLNNASGDASWVGGGEGNDAQGKYTGISGGKFNNAVAGWSVVVGGFANAAENSSGLYQVVP